jgi:hypothetical protein
LRARPRLIGAGAWLARARPSPSVLGAGCLSIYRFLRILAYLNPMVESRRASRLHVFRTGTIKFVGGGAINCMVRNLSSTGASLEVSNPAGIPERFILVVPGDGLHLLCRPVWRKGHGIGVTFG